MRLELDLQQNNQENRQATGRMHEQRFLGADGHEFCPGTFQTLFTTRKTDTRKPTTLNPSFNC